MPSIRPVLVVGAGNHDDLVAALRAHGLGPLFASDLDHAIRLLRNFRVDAVLAEGIAAEGTRILAERAPTVVVGGVERDAWESGASGFVEKAEIQAAPDVIYRVVRGERRVRGGSTPGESVVSA
jgi:hypothetical protein